MNDTPRTEKAAFQAKNWPGRVVGLDFARQKESLIEFPHMKGYPYWNSVITHWWDESIMPIPRPED